jgi:hypothetical protein
MADREFFWDKAKLIWQWTAGKDSGILSPLNARDILEEQVIPSITKEAERSAQTLVDGKITLVQFQVEMEGHIKRAHTVAGAAGGGGWKNLSVSQWGRVGRLIRTEYDFFRSFIRGIESGDTALDGRIVTRARMYITAAFGTFEEILRTAAQIAGFGLERRVLMQGAKHCSPCRVYAQLGWQPAFTLPAIGEACDCLSNCLCHFEFM